MKESELEKKFRDLVRGAGGKAYKFVSPGNAGVPDRIVVLPGGRIGFVELKRPGEDLRKLQRLRQEELRGLGCLAEMVDSPERAREVLAQIQEQASELSRADRLFEEMINRNPAARRGKS